MFSFTISDTIDFFSGFVVIVVANKLVMAMEGVNKREGREEGSEGSEKCWLMERPSVIKKL